MLSPSTSKSNHAALYGDRDEYHAISLRSACRLDVSNRLYMVFCAGQPGPRDPKQEVFLAFARVFSGVVTDGQLVHVLSAAYNPARPDLERQEVQVSAPCLY